MPLGSGQRAPDVGGLGVTHALEQVPLLGELVDDPVEFPVLVDDGLLLHVCVAAALVLRGGSEGLSISALLRVAGARRIAHDPLRHSDCICLGLGPPGLLAPLALGAADPDEIVE